MWKRVGCSILLFIVTLNSVRSYKSGAPASRCVSMLPVHSGITPQTSTGVFMITTDTTDATDGRVKVTIAGKADQEYAGFILEARSGTDTTPVGTFVNLPPNAKGVKCANTDNSAVTHKNNNRKQSIEVEWVAPPNYEGDIYFIATVAANYSTFWSNITSTPLKVEAQSSTFFSDTVPAVITPTELNMYDGCGSKKYCVGSTIGCIENKDCVAIVSTRKRGYQYEFEMMAKQSVYVASGISEDNKMGGDAIFECVNENTGAPNSIKAYRSWNVPNFKQNKRLDDQSGFYVKSATYIDNLIYCKLLIEPKIKIEENVFDLDTSPYYLLIAAGSDLKAQGVGFHGNAYTASPDRRLVSEIGLPVIKDEFYNECNTLKNCFGYPVGCVTQQNCKAVAAILAQGNRYEFELKAESNAYIALGLSTDTKMGGDSVMECVHDEGSGGKIKAYMSWNKVGDKANTRIKNQDGINLLNGTYLDGYIYCKFTRNVQTEVEQQNYDLLNDKYYLLLAAGTSLKENSVGFHDTLYVSSGQSSRLSDVGSFSAESKLLVRLHGSFMIAAWIGAASLGIVLARYFKQTWVGSSLCAKDLWFAWHRFFMLLTWSLTIVAFVLIFVENGAWVGGSSQIHAILGCITTFLCLVQPIGAAFRPHPTARNRPVFNWLHWLMGNSAHTLAIVTIFFAVPLNDAELPQWFDWILVAFVAFYVAMHVLFGVSACISERSNSKRVNSFPMKDMNTRSSLNSMERKQDAPHSGFRRFMLFIHALGIILLAAAMIVVVALAPIESQWTKLQNKFMSQ